MFVVLVHACSQAIMLLSSYTVLGDHASRPVAWLVWLSSSSCPLSSASYEGFWNPGHCPVYMGSSIGGGWHQASLPFWYPCCAVRGIPVLSSATSSPYSIAAHRPRSGSHFPSQSQTTAVTRHVCIAFSWTENPLASSSRWMWGTEGLRGCQKPLWTLRVLP